MDRDNASVVGGDRTCSDSGYASEATRSLGRSQARSNDSHDLQRLQRGATRGARSSLNAIADRLTEQLVETADALVRHPRTVPAGASLGIRTSVIVPVPRRPLAAAILQSPESPAVSSQCPPSAARHESLHNADPNGRGMALPRSQITDERDASDDEDVDEEPVRLAQIVSPRTGKTRTVVHNPPELSSNISTSVGDVELPTFMRSKQVGPPPIALHLSKLLSLPKGSAVGQNATTSVLAAS
ncbi:hypothetical protein JCM3774_000772 [Rhodotorula dairenensis]